MADTLETNLTDPRTATEHKVADLGPWFHNLHLPDGTQTAPEHPLGDFPSYKWDKLAPHLPDEMTGWRVLDVGCNAGYYSLKLAQRGADVHAVDVNPRYLTQARWAAEQFDVSEHITFEELQVYDLARRDATYDLVLFLGVFYHLRYPLLALDLLASRTERLLAFQSLTMPDEPEHPDVRDRDIDDRRPLSEPGWPRMAFVEKQFAGDPTNWWVPNTSGLEAMLRSSGLRVVARPVHEFYLCEPDENANAATRWTTDAQLAAVTGPRVDHPDHPKDL